MIADVEPKDGQKVLILRLKSEDEFDDLLLRFFDCACATFRYESGYLIAELDQPRE